MIQHAVDVSGVDQEFYINSDDSEVATGVEVLPSPGNEVTQFEETPTAEAQPDVDDEDLSTASHRYTPANCMKEGST